MNNVFKQKIHQAYERKERSERRVKIINDKFKDQIRFNQKEYDEKLEKE